MSAVELTESREVTALQQSIADHIREGNKGAAAALEQYRLAGVDLLQLREIAPNGAWLSLLAEIGIQPRFASRCIRLATYWEVLPQEVKASSVFAANEVLASLPPAMPRGFKKDSDKADFARRMKADGVSVSDISRSLGVHWGTVKSWLDPEYKARKLRATAKRKHEAGLLRAARRREERDALAAGSSDANLSKAYGYIRQAAAAIDRARTEASGETRQVLNRAYEGITETEAAIVAALRMERAK